MAAVLVSINIVFGHIGKSIFAKRRMFALYSLLTLGQVQGHIDPGYCFGPVNGKIVD